MANVGNIAYPQPTFTAGGSTDRAIIGTLASPGNLPTNLTNVPAKQTGASDKLGQQQSHGISPPSAVVNIEVSQACIVQLNIWSRATKQWLPATSGSAGYQKTFTAAGTDFFVLKPGDMFYITCDTASTKGYTDAPLHPDATPPTLNPIP